MKSERANETNQRKLIILDRFETKKIELLSLFLGDNNKYLQVVEQMKMKQKYNNNQQRQRLNRDTE